MPPSSTSQQAGASSIQAALRTMAQGSPSDVGTITVALAHLHTAFGVTAVMDNPRYSPQLTAQLPALLQGAARQMWASSMSVVNGLWNVRLPHTQGALQSLLEPCRRPQVPGGSCFPLLAMSGLFMQACKHSL